MKILLVCAGGMSTSILMKKMESYWKEAGEELEIKAVGLGEYQDVYQNYDIVLVGPQVSYRLNEIKENTGLPCAAIQSFDYAVANCPNIMKLAKKLFEEKNK
ncbi:PTS sugar transporter subunit IIB [Caloramator sp. E03]|uniref:PTS sugar transporter subunit IIB n=1 Tax=Caloramator sp. E03 TaxID=2576307 RepID=UPI0011105E55|nr:PTS sugar transporter subunit IIB [Caloramator sp. E03]QCX34288.1 PTS sugar transporter subunit IIB [Caloramator sp. E03]